MKFSYTKNTESDFFIKNPNPISRGEGLALVIFFTNM